MTLVLEVNVGDRVADALADVLNRRGIEALPARDVPLRDAGLTSLDLVNLILTLEAVFDLNIPEDRITAPNLKNRAALEAMILSLQP